MPRVSRLKDDEISFKSIFLFTALSPVYGHISTTFEGLTTIRAFGLEQRFESQYMRYLEDATACRFLSLLVQRGIGFTLDSFALTYICAISIMLVTVPNGMLTGGDVGLVLSSILGLTGLFQWAVRLTADFETQMVSVERVLAYGKLVPEAPLTSLTLKDKALQAWSEHGSVQFKSVFLTYASSPKPVLCNISFKVTSCQKIGIVGRTGAGKSSLITVLFRLAEPDGAILIDGVDTKLLGLHELRKKISIIPQDLVLFSGTIRRNLDPFNEYQDDDLWKCLKEANLNHLVRSMEGHLEGLVMEGGSNLSVGQRQLLCLARALLANNKILVLDEATANVDHETDQLIQTTIKTKFASCTVLTIAHRLNTIIDMDKVLVLEAGEVVEFDHPHTLLKRHGHFFGMVKQTGNQMSKILHKQAEESYKKKKMSEGD